MEQNPDAFVTAWAPEPEVVIDLVAVVEDEEAEEDIEVILKDVEALRSALEAS